jgi:hypothetical protein
MKDLYIPTPSELEITVFENESPYGITIVGEAQSGKSTLCNGITEGWKSLEPAACIMHFSNSDGFRGLTAEILDTAGISGDRIIDASCTQKIVEEYLEKYGICDEKLDAYYQSPKPKTVLRTPAVNEMVAFVAEHTQLRPAINRAGSRFMKEIISNPAVAHLEIPPNLFVLDARSIPECSEKFDNAGVQHLGSFILLCRPSVVVDRTDDDNGLTTQQRIKSLEERNRKDRERSIAKMSLPSDYPGYVEISDAVSLVDRRALYKLGRKVELDPRNRPMVLNTEHTSRVQTEESMQYILSGLVAQ